MDTGGGRGERPDNASGGSGISRRHFLAGGAMTIGGTATFVDEGTSARFSDTESASGTIELSGFPKLDYVLIDRTQNRNVEYRVQYQVENVSDFDRVDVEVTNITEGTGPWNESFSEIEGVFDFPFDGGSLGGRDGHTFEFIFEVYETGESNAVVTETVEDQADGQGSGDGEFADEDSPKLDWLLVDDNSTPGTSNVEYEVYYAVDNLAEFGEMEIDFQSSAGDWASQARTNTNSPIGKVIHGEGNTDDTYDIVANVKNENGLTVDSITIEDVADGIDPSVYGDPALPDSPSLDSFTVTDESPPDRAAFGVDYTLSNTSRLAGVEVTFDNRSGNDYADETIVDHAPPSDPITYPPDGDEYWLDGDTYHVTVEVFETREGITFPITSGTVSIRAHGDADSKTYPADSV